MHDRSFWSYSCSLSDTIPPSGYYIQFQDLLYEQYINRQMRDSGNVRAYITSFAEETVTSTWRIVEQGMNYVTLPQGQSDIQGISLAGVPDGVINIGLYQVDLAGNQGEEVYGQATLGASASPSIVAQQLFAQMPRRPPVTPLTRTT